MSESENKAKRDAPCRGTRLEESASRKVLEQYEPSFLPGRYTVHRYFVETGVQLCARFSHKKQSMPQPLWTKD